MWLGFIAERIGKMDVRENETDEIPLTDFSLIGMTCRHHLKRIQIEQGRKCVFHINIIGRRSSRILKFDKELEVLYFSAYQALCSLSSRIYRFPIRIKTSQNHTIHIEMIIVCIIVLK